MRSILPFIYLNGKIVTKKNALIPALDNGFLYGTGIFTTVKIREGVPLFLNRHLARLQSNASQLGIPLLPCHSCESGNPATFPLLTSAVSAIIQKNNLASGGLRITLSPATLCIHAFTLPLGTCGTRDTPDTLKTITLPDPRDIYKTIKTTYRLPNLLAQKQAQIKETDDAIFTQNNKLIESTNSNILSCQTNSHFSTLNSQFSILTPPLKGRGLNGITIQILMENLPIQQKPVPSDTTDPLILVNSLSLQIVESINGTSLKQNPEFVKLIRQTLDKTEKMYITNSPYT